MPDSSETGDHEPVQPISPRPNQPSIARHPSSPPRPSASAAHPRSVSVLSLPSMSVHVPCPWKIPLVRTLTKSYDKSSQIVNVTQSSPCTLWVAFNIPAHFPAALLTAETETGVDGGGGNGSTGAHPINPMTPHTSIPTQRARSH